MLARHTDIQLTMRNYTDPALLDGWAAVENLPDLDGSDADELRATGTDESVVLPVVLNHGEHGRADANTPRGQSRQPAATSRVSALVRDDAEVGQTGGGGNRM